MNENDTEYSIIKMRSFRTYKNNDAKKKITSDLINMLFEIVISFVPILLYWVVFVITNTSIDFFEHIKNGSIIWTCLTILVTSNFSLLISTPKRNDVAQNLVIACIIFFILILTGLFLILNFSSYGFWKLTLDKVRTTVIVILFSISTLVINIVRIFLFS